MNYFDRRIEDFDKIYDRSRSRFGNWLDRTMRASVVRRFDLAFELLGDLTGKSVLDIGCGSGRYMFEAVKRGAGRVVGIEAAAGALKAAGRIAAELGLEDRVKFLETDFVDFQLPEKFDIILAVGYFDYVFNPARHLEKMLAISNGRVYASFPRRWHPLTPVRKIRLAFNRCAVRFYARNEIEKMLIDSGCRDFDIRKVARDWVVLVRK